LEDWNDGRLEKKKTWEYWKDGLLEYWEKKKDCNDGVLDKVEGDGKIWVTEI
jgi:hypothetical protein